MKVKVSHEVPIELLETSKIFNDYDYYYNKMKTNLEIFSKKLKKEEGLMKKKPKINISDLLKKHKAGKSIGSTNRARLVARGLIARKSGPHKGKKKDLGRRGKS